MIKPVTGRALLATAVAVGLAGCTGEAPTRSAQLASPSPSVSVPLVASATPTPSARQTAATSGATPTADSQQIIELTVTEVAGVPVGTAAAEAERRLRDAIGLPTQATELPACNGETGRLLVWEQLRVFIVGESGADPVLAGWTAEPSERFDYRLPFGTRLDESAAATQRRVPRSSGSVAKEGPLTGTYVVTTPDGSGLLWIARGSTAEDPIVDVSFRALACD